MVVLQTEQFPFMALRPFFIVTSCGFFISVFFLHLTQYASVIGHILSLTETRWENELVLSPHTVAQAF